MPPDIAPTDGEGVAVLVAGLEPTTATLTRVRTPGEDGAINLVLRMTSVEGVAVLPGVEGVETGVVMTVMLVTTATDVPLVTVATEVGAGVDEDVSTVVLTTTVVDVGVAEEVELGSVVMGGGTEEADVLMLELELVGASVGMTVPPGVLVVLLVTCAMAGTAVSKASLRKRIVKLETR